MKFNRSTFAILSLFMICFGVLIGIVFPYFALSFGLAKAVVLSFNFRFSCIVAGILVAAVNVLLVKVIVIRKFTILTVKMKTIVSKLIDSAMGSSDMICDIHECHILENSEDAIGENVQAYNQLVDALSLIMKNQILGNELDTSKISDQTLSFILERTESLGGVVIVENEGNLVIEASHGIKDANSLTENQMISSVFYKRRKVSIDFPKDIHLDGILASFKPKRILLEPILYKQKCLGIVLVAADHFFTEYQMTDFAIICKSFAASLYNSRIYRQTQELAAHDPLTGILNRRYGMVRLKEEFSRSNRDNTPLGLIMLDIDHFKDINDTNGHLSGDKVLIQLTEVAKQVLREGDVFMRYGGDEFCILLPGCDSAETYDIAERIRLEIDSNEMNITSNKIQITVSLGLSSYPEYNVTRYNILMEAADSALYDSKMKGRNTTSIKLSD